MALGERERCRVDPLRVFSSPSAPLSSICSPSHHPTPGAVGPTVALLLSGLQRKGRLPVSYHAAHSKKILSLLSLKGTTFLNGSHFKSEWEGTWASERMKLYSGNFKSQAQTTQRIQSRW